MTPHAQTLAVLDANGLDRAAAIHELLALARAQTVKLKRRRLRRRTLEGEQARGQFFYACDLLGMEEEKTRDIGRLLDYLPSVEAIRAMLKSPRQARLEKPK